MLWKTECTTLTPPGTLTARSYVLPGFLVAFYTQLCQFIVPLSLKVASSDQTNQKIPFQHTHAKTTHSIPFSNLDHPYSLHRAILVRMVATSHAA